MAYREVSRMEINQIIRRWQAKEGPRQIAAGTGLSRNTVRKYLAAARLQGITQGGPATTGDRLSRLATISQVGPRPATTPRQDQLEPWADQIYQWITKDRLQMTRIHELLAMRGCDLSYQSLRRFIINRNRRRRSKTTVRMADTPPGEVAEADFGRLGMITDPATGKRKAVWAMVIDNFPAAVVGTDPLHPVLTRGFLEYAQHRGFIPDPARKGHPQDKPKVERKVPYARERFYKGADFDDFTHVRAAAPKWRLEVVGMRIHGATRKKPLVVRVDSKLVRIYLRGQHQDPHAPTQGRQIHRRGRLPTQGRTLHHQGSRRAQARGRQTGNRSGRIRRAPLQRRPPLGQDPAGTQAAALG